ncbi:hypothetical protein RhiirA5_365123 [Rhizophagus irregularis]|uniref:Uncharacterized protein n=3 Tax=Rhizophagus irregularis TaxID=588596 RepID=A0A2N0P335_9GLOM|nr:hypothetical protein RirG_217380 [Rhizophagus irregularis DAOM 197198w]PKC01207.1 hypothetical protein RhiirA5_365123 [Rhizophagus irregularis]
MTTRIPAFNSMPHDFDLSLAICRRSRSDIIETSKIFDDTDIQKVYEDTETEYIELMKKCGTLILVKDRKLKNYMKIFVNGLEYS